MSTAIEDAPGIRARIGGWETAEVELGFVYLRSGGGLIQTGRARIAAFSDVSLTLKTEGSNILLVLAGAQVDASPQIFFTADLSDNFQMPGIGIGLANHDWLFLSDSASPAELARLHSPQQFLAWDPATRLSTAHAATNG